MELKKSLKFYKNTDSINFADSIIENAIKKSASDIHFEPFYDEAFIRYRIDGDLEKESCISKNTYKTVCSRIKVMAGLDITEKRLPQDGKIYFTYDEKSFDLRVSTLPTVYGEKVVIRILYKFDSQDIVSILDQKIKNEYTLRELLNEKSGMVLVTGPTGSGKSTTLYTMINEINTESRNIVTIEDPVEYTIKGVSQVNVNEKIGFDFEAGLKSILRQDPDVIMVGEIRDSKTALVAARAGITGHLVFSTLHTKDAVSAVTRLNDIGIPYYLIASTLKVVIAQRLVKKICTKCRYKYVPSEIEKRLTGIDDKTFLYRGKGCRFCKGTGYSGRTAVYEILYIDDESRKIIEEGKNFERLKGKILCSIAQMSKKLLKEGIININEYMKAGFAV